MFGRVLFATDFSPYAEAALGCVAGLPGVQEVVLLHVAEEARSPRGGGGIGDTLYRARDHSLREERCTLERMNPALRVKTVVKVSSDTAGAILETAEETGVSLIVAGARGNSIVEGILLGSVSRAIIHRARTSVLIMRHRIVEGAAGRTYQLYCPMILSRVLCPVDFSPHADRALAVLAGTPGVREAILLHVVSRGETGQEIGDAAGAAETQLEAAAAGLSARGIRTRTLVRTGDPGAGIAAAAEEEDASVVWMSSHGKGWFRELLLGSTAYSVAMNAPRPVIIIRAGDGQGTG